MNKPKFALTALALVPLSSCSNDLSYVRDIAHAPGNVQGLASSVEVDLEQVVDAQPVRSQDWSMAGVWELNNAQELNNDLDWEDPQSLAPAWHPATSAVPAIALELGRETFRIPALGFGQSQDGGRTQEASMPDHFGDQQEAVQVEWFKAGYYAGVKFGKSGLGTNSGDLADDLLDRGHATTVDLENDDSTFSLYGGYRFALPLSVELGWVNLGQVESEIAATPANLNVFLNDVAEEHAFLGKGVNLRGIVHVLDTERVQLGLGLGVWAWSADVEAEAASGQIVRIDESGIDLNYTVQALISLGNGFSAVFSFEVFNLDENVADVISFGVQGSL